MLQVPDVIVEANWLHENLENSRLIILDATIKKVSSLPNKILQHEQIKNSLFFDLKNTFSIQESKFPNTVLDVSTFEVEAKKLGINLDSCIVVYDQVGIYSSPRVWWLFKLMGFENIAVLNGGFPQWKLNNYPSTTKKINLLSMGNFVTKYHSSLCISKEKVFGSLLNNDSKVLDARSHCRFEGTSPEPRKGLPSGRIPYSSNIPFCEVLDDSRLKSKAELEKIFKPFVSNSKIIFSCGSGITACILALAYNYIGKYNYTVYDGSWTEWASNVSLPKEL
jgi:thiosulfate/3-mercaptopyruvate sulfurtransferase